MKWQTIDTAPKDAWFLAFEDDNYYECCWISLGESGCWNALALPIHGIGYGAGHAPSPTHWMPLPEAPQ